MNIVYGVSGDGLGHVFEALEIASILRRDGHAVKILTYGDRACDTLREFGPMRIRGLPLAFTARGLSVFRTLVNNADFLPFYFKNWRRLKRELAAFKPDVFLTAYEPFTTLVSHVFGKPLVSMDNQNALLYMKNSPRGHRSAFMLAKFATRICTFGASHYIVKSYHPTESSSDKVRFVAPIIQNEIRRIQPSIGAHVLVYLTRPNPELIGVLRSIDETFIVYCEDKVGEDGNLIFRAHGGSYLRDLASCKAILGTTGFSLIADAIYLKKPYYGLPLKKQFEQTRNGFFLAESGLGEFSEEVSKEKIVAFLGRLGMYRERLARRNFNPAEQEEALRAVLRQIESVAKPLATGALAPISSESPDNNSCSQERA
jgi:uncharacterized protein (TIGR00661 family)